MTSCFSKSSSAFYLILKPVLLLCLSLTSWLLCHPRSAGKHGGEQPLLLAVISRRLAADLCSAHCLLLTKCVWTDVATGSRHSSGACRKLTQDGFLGISHVRDDLLPPKGKEKENEKGLTERLAVALICRKSLASAGLSLPLPGCITMGVFASSVLIRFKLLIPEF